MALGLTELLILGGLPLAGSLINKSAIDDSNKISAQQLALANKLATAPVYSPYGDVTQVGQPPQLTPETQALMNKLRSVESQGADTTLQRGAISQDLLNTFKTGFNEQNIRDQAKAATTADRQFVQRDIVNPALDRAATIDARINRGSSNPNRTLEAVSQGAAPTLANFGETAALNLGNQQVDQFIKNSLGLATSTDPNKASASYQQPEPFNAGQTANAANAITAAGSNVPIPNLAIGQGLGSSAALVQAGIANQDANQRSNALMDYFTRTLGNQGTKVGG